MYPSLLSRIAINKSPAAESNLPQKNTPTDHFTHARRTLLPPQLTPIASTCFLPEQPPSYNNKSKSASCRGHNPIEGQKRGTFPKILRRASFRPCGPLDRSPAENPRRPMNPGSGSRSAYLRPPGTCALPLLLSSVPSAPARGRGPDPSPLPFFGAVCEKFAGRVLPADGRWRGRAVNDPGKFARAGLTGYAEAKAHVFGYFSWRCGVRIRHQQLPNGVAQPPLVSLSALVMSLRN